METSENITHNGVIAFRHGSFTPYVRQFKGDKIVMIPVLVEDYEKARGMEGENVNFKIFKWPYGPHISSDVGFAKLLF